jgi:hypothetical protein
MLHTWNWIAHPDGATAHQNRAIPFLRAGLSVPSLAEFDSETGRDALEVLALAQGDTRKRYEGAFLILDWGFFGKWGPRRTIRTQEKRAEDAVDQMRDAERLGDRVLYAAAARRGAALQGSLERELAERFDLEERAVVERWLASLVVHDHTGHTGH